MKKKLFLVFPVVFSMLSSIVFAAQQNWFNKILEPFFGWDIAGTYQQASSFIDFILYIFVFLYVSRYAIGKRFEGPTAKGLSVVLSIILSIGMAVFERMFDFNIGKLAPFSGLILIIVISFIVFQVIKGFGGATPGALSWAYLLTFFILSATVNEYLLWLYDKVPLLEGLLYIGVLFAIFGVIKSFGGIWKATAQWGPTVGETGDAIKKGGKWGADQIGKIKKMNDEQRKSQAKKKEIKSYLNQVNEHLKKLKDIKKNIVDNEKFWEDEVIKQIKAVEEGINYLGRIRDEIQRLQVEIQNLQNRASAGEFKGLELKIEQLRLKYNQLIKNYDYTLKGVLQRDKQLKQRYPDLLKEAVAEEAVAEEEEKDIALKQKATADLIKEVQKEISIQSRILEDLKGDATKIEEQKEVKDKIIYLIDELKRLNKQLKSEEEQRKAVKEEKKTEKKKIKLAEEQVEAIKRLETLLIKTLDTVDSMKKIESQYKDETTGKFINVKKRKESNRVTRELENKIRENNKELKELINKILGREIEIKRLTTEIREKLLNSISSKQDYGEKKEELEKHFK